MFEKLEAALLTAIVVSVCGCDSATQDAEVVEVANFLYALEFDGEWKPPRFVADRQIFTRRDGLVKLTIGTVPSDETEADLSAQLDAFIQGRQSEIGGPEITDVERTSLGEFVVGHYSGVNSKKWHYRETVVVRSRAIMYFYCESRTGNLAACDDAKITIMPPP